MKQVKIFLIQYGVLLAFLVIFQLLGRIQSDGETYGSQAFNDGWFVSVGDETDVYYDSLPQIIDSNENVVVYSRILSETECKDQLAISFFQNHNEVFATIDGVEVYRHDKGATTYTKTSGPNIHSVNMRKDYIGKTLKITIIDPYKSNKVTTPNFVLCEADDVIPMFTRGKIIPAFASFIMFSIGFVLVIIYFLINRAYPLEKKLVWLGCFAISIGLWSLVETEILVLFMQNKILISHLGYMSLKLTCIPAMQFFAHSIDRPDLKVVKYLCNICLADFIITTLLQMAGLLDYKETVGITHGYLFVGVIYVLVYYMKKAIQDKKAGGIEEAYRKKKLGINIGLAFVGMCVIADGLRFYLDVNYNDAAMFSRFGLLLYITYLGAKMLRESLRLMSVEKEAEILKDEAFHDAVTRLENRLAFQKCVEQLGTEEQKQYGVAMCDLNGLKFFNDHYGHSFGDSYIFISAEMICDTFSKYGKIYRVGGDEFCILAKDLPENEFEKLYAEMNLKIDALSNSYFEERMGIAIGYTLFDGTKDRNLFDTEKRADEIMYAKKAEMKKENARFARTEGSAGVASENPLLNK